MFADRSSSCLRRAGGSAIERGGDILHADDADETVVVYDRQMSDVVLVHDGMDALECVFRTAGHELRYRDKLRDFHVDGGRTAIGDRTCGVAISKDSSRGIALGMHDVLDHNCTHIVCTH